MKRLDALMLYAYQKKQEQEREQEETKELSVTEKRQMGRDKKKKILSLTEEVKDLAFRMRELFLMQDICEQLGIELPERSGLPDNWDILTLDDHRRYLIIRRDGCSLDNLLQSYLRILLIEQAGTVRADIYFNPAMSFMGELKIPDQLEMLEYGMEEMDDLIQYMEKNFLPRFEDIERRVFEAVDGKRKRKPLPWKYPRKKKSKGIKEGKGMSRLDEIKRVGEMQKQKATENEQKKNERLEELQDKVRNLSPRIRELNETMDACYENKILDNCWHRNPMLQEKGFQRNFPLVDRDGKKIGFTQGGSKHQIGYWDNNGQFSTDGEKHLINIYAVRKNMDVDEKYIRDCKIDLLEGFCQQFDEFEKTFYEIVDLELEKRNADLKAGVGEKIEEDEVER